MTFFVPGEISNLLESKVKSSRCFSWVTKKDKSFHELGTSEWKWLICSRITEVRLIRRKKKWWIWMSEFCDKLVSDNYKQINEFRKNERFIEVLKWKRVNYRPQYFCVYWFSVGVEWSLSLVLFLSTTPKNNVT